MAGRPHSTARHVPRSPEILSNLPSLAKRLFRSVADGVVAQDCFLCGGVAGGLAVCGACRAELPAHPAASCPVCAVPTAGGAVCAACLRQPPLFDASLAVFDYRFPVDVLLQALKYRHRLPLAGFFAAAALEAARECLAGADLIVPMPLHRRRLVERGFNQAARIAQYAGRALEIPQLWHGVDRIRDTPSQTGLDRDQRHENVRGAFAISGKRALRRLREAAHVAVIDDVTTTGSTLAEMKCVLLAAGVRRVDLWAVARVEGGQ